jgi:hypothetical protein
MAFGAWVFGIVACIVGISASRKRAGFRWIEPLRNALWAD